MQTIKIDNGPPGMRLVGFWVDAEFRAGEYRLVPVGEAGDKDARIAELEIKLKNSDTYGKAMADDNRGLRVAIAGSEADDPGHWQAAAEVEAACHDEARIERAAAFAAIREIVELFRFDSSTRTLEISAILKRHGIEVAE